MTGGTTAPVITIDGPSGSGKGTIAKLLARQLGWHILDSGALYRLTALSAVKQGVDLNDPGAVAGVARKLDVEFRSGQMDQPVSVYLMGEDVTEEIRTETCGDKASQIAPHTVVREALLQRQRDFRRMPGLVADGRDMGTVVFPDSPCKVYLTASAEIRAQRRYEQLKQQGQSVKIAHLLSEIKARDDRDMNRENAPLRPADDAVTLDTSGIPIDEVLREVLQIWSSKQA
ncbi:cytidylate kinase [Hahella sp. CCB-MM4]|uniref:(d)CMP kinase n=1 Tax=Hahella sp. (strain CCB-MM4) TaxID=1926491 RepID=UPI000B9A7A63|nr:(d)CMP kinase [Hahella sp. CCB-MM4]OZG72057.1 cytidylate kinase [Hahella sp. CCB-MM4]